MIPILIDQPLTVALQKATSLQAFVKIGRIGSIASRQAGVDDFQAVESVEPCLLGGLPHPLLSTDQERRSESLLDETGCSPNNLLLLAFGKHDAFRLAAESLEDSRQHAGNWIATGAQLIAILAHVDNGPASNARIHCGLGNSRRDRGNQPRIKRDGND